MKAFAILVALTACGGWSKRDTALELLAQAEFVVDYRQTQAAVDRANSNGTMYEWNPIIGAHGENVSPSVYFVGVGLVHLAIAAALPPKYRVPFEALTIGVQGQNVITNHSTFERQRFFDARARRTP